MQIDFSIIFFTIIFMAAPIFAAYELGRSHAFTKDAFPIIERLLKILEHK